MSKVLDASLVVLDFYNETCIHKKSKWNTDR